MKPDIRADIQNTASGRLGIMMQLRIVKYEKNEEEQQDDKEYIPYGKKVLKKLVMPWDNKNRIVCADS